MTKREKLDLLAQVNPFISSSAGDPNDIKYPHAASVNAAALEDIIRLIRQKLHNPKENAAVLVLGEVGAGKTHLIARLLEFAKTSGYHLPVAYIHPLEDTDRPYTWLLHEIIANLAEPLNTDDSMIEFKNSTRRITGTLLDWLSAEMMIEYLQKKQPSKNNRSIIENLKNPLKIFKKMNSNVINQTRKHAALFFSNLMPSFPLFFFDVLFDLIQLSLRHSALTWLRGELLSESDKTALRFRRYQIQNSLSPEACAKERLKALGTLLGRYRHPMIVCFDRLENLDTDAHIRAFGKIIEFMVDVAPAMLPLAFFRGSQWQNDYRYRFNQHVVTRLETNIVELQGCDPEQSIEIIHRRLSQIYGVQLDPDDIFPFDRHELLRQFSGDIQSPREVIMQANQYLKQMLKQTESAPHQNNSHASWNTIFYQFYQSIASGIEDYPVNDELIQRGLFLYLVYSTDHNGYQIETPRKSEISGIDFECIITKDDKRIKLYWIIYGDSAHQTLATKLKRGVDLLEKSYSAVYIRDSRQEISVSWKTCQNLIRHFKNLGGYFFHQNSDLPLALYALAEIEQQSNSNNMLTKQLLCCEDEHDGLAEFIKNQICANQHELFRDLHDIFINL